MENKKLSPEWVDALRKFAELIEYMAFSNPTQSVYHLGTLMQMPTQLTVLSLLPHKEEEEEEVFIEKADFDEDILSAAAKMNCSGEVKKEL